MTLAEKLLQVVEDISDEKLSEVIDLAEYLKLKEEKETKDLINNIVDKYDEALKELAK
ncbi:DUF2281 domain-containing protein [Inconstantimicrobium mannanitabidum]|uniref:Uncharacterized protein n=1 Tax=Inconstantimicrobium mannanitabidum TaxID=1604901 RepID=A0ACB5RGL2_9CLOT|nr:DUF2281 domain-containing protein [Clostridium sp. TW13]GKX68230.1 hypothetical protein rsdtw13_34880 [Clostridium sp. TW13]